MSNKEPSPDSSRASRHLTLEAPRASTARNDTCPQLPFVAAGSRSDTSVSTASNVTHPHMVSVGHSTYSLSTSRPSHMQTDSLQPSVAGVSPESLSTPRPRFLLAYEPHRDYIDDARTQEFHRWPTAGVEGVDPLIPTERSRPGTSGQPMLDTRNLRDRHLGARDTQENDACMAMVVQDQITHEEEITPLHDMSYMNAILYEEARGLGPVKLLPAQASHRPPAVTLEDQRLAFNVVDSRVVADITRPSHSVADPSPSTGVSSEHPVATAFAVASNTVTSRSQRSLELGAAGTAAESPRAITSRTQTGSRALSSVNASFVSVNSASNDNAVLVSSPLASTYTVPSSSGSSFSGTASVRSGQQLDSGIDTSQGPVDVPVDMVVASEINPAQTQGAYPHHQHVPAIMDPPNYL